MSFSSPYAVYVLASYGAAFAILGGLALLAWRDWRRVKAAWERLPGRREAP
ncbi:heme exporter protein CcmD [Oleispirillum naphthae]|uniref:heme exporter protein CcmD n=1 Tax=Oleispirillum naphthae TaxID=2838853 RepID=UPI0030826412